MEDANAWKVCVHSDPIVNEIEKRKYRIELQKKEKKKLENDARERKHVKVIHVPS